MATSKKTTAKAGSKSKPKTSAGRKKTTPIKKQANAVKSKSSSPVSKEISSIILSAASVFVFFSMYFENITGFLGAPVKSFFMGMFGIGAYILPLIVIALSVVSLINKDFRLAPVKVAQGASVFIAFLVFMHLLGYSKNGEYGSAINYIGSYYESGAANNGGLTGAAFGNVLLSIFGKFGAYLIIVIIFISMGMVLTGKSVIAVLAGLYMEIKERLEEARAYDDEYEYEEEYEEEYVPKKTPVRAKEKKEQRPREQLRFEMPPVINERRSKPPNIIIENRRKPSIEKDILIFNKEEKTMRKPILMPPTRKVVDIMTLKRPEERSDIVITNNAEALSEFATAPHKQGEEIYVETPLIRHYERRSFTDNVPFSDGGRFKHQDAGIQDESAMQEERTGLEYNDAEPTGDSSAFGASDTYDTYDDTDTYSTYDDTDTYSTYDAYDTNDISDTYESTDDVDDASGSYEDTENTEDTDDSIDPNELEATESHGESDYPDDFTQMMSAAYEQKLHEQEMNALMLAKTGPHPALGAQLPSPPTRDNPPSAPQTPPQKPTEPSPMPFMEKRPVEKGTPITIIREDYSFPSINLLNKPPINLSSVSRSQILETSRKLEETLKSFGVDARVIEVSKGPTVTRYELSPGPGVKVRKISDLGNDLALNLAAESIRIEAPIPGKAAVGIEIPNKEVTPVYLREVIDDDLFMNYPSKLAFALGKDITGNTVVTDIAKMPHLLIAGATGSGKSVCINTLITSLIYKADPNDVKLVMIDPKVVELSVYNGIPHLLIPVVTEPKKAAGALNWAVQEMLARYNAFAETSVRDLKGYNAYIREHGDGEPLPQIVIIIDELADLMMAAPGEVEDAICRLAQMARAAGLHLIIATQRPSVDVITGVIKANIPSRLAFSVSSGTDSRTILDMVGAEKLLGKGDMLFCPMGTSKPTRVQGAFITDKEVESIVNFLKAGRVHNYDMDVIAKISAPKGIGETNDDLDEFFEDAIEFIIQKEKASASMLQRQFRIGYNRASRLIEEFEARGIVGAEDGSKPRKVLMTAMQFEEYKLNKQ